MNKNERKWTPESIGRYDIIKTWHDKEKFEILVNRELKGEWVRYSDIEPVLNALAGLNPSAIPEVVEALEYSKRQLEDCIVQFLAGGFYPDHPTIRRIEDALKTAKSTLEKIKGGGEIADK